MRNDEQFKIDFSLISLVENILINEMIYIRNKKQNRFDLSLFAKILRNSTQNDAYIVLFSKINSKIQVEFFLYFFKKIASFKINIKIMLTPFKPFSRL